MRVIFFMLFLIFFCKVDAQPPEAFYVHFDREFYAAGDDVWYKVYSLNPADLQSKVLYVDVVDHEGVVRISQKLKLEEKTAHGDFHIPPDWEEGIYTFRAYTNWSLNFGSAFIFSKKIPVYQLIASSEPSSIPVLEKAKYNPFSNGTAEKDALQIELKTSDGIYKRGEEVIIEISTKNAQGQPVAANLSMVVKDLALVTPKNRPDLIAQKKERLRVALEKTANPLNLEHPVEQGLTLRTFVFHEEMSQVLAGRLPSVFIVESREKVRCELGVEPLTHLLPEFYGKRTIQYLDFSPLGRSSETYDLEVVPQKIVTSSGSKVELPHNPSIDRYLHFRQEQKRMEQVFNLSPSSPIPEYPVPGLAGKADKFYKIDDYVTFRNVLEFVEEVISVPLIKIERKGGQPSLRMFNQVTNRRLLEAPLYLINNYLTFDEQAVLNMDLENVERIELFTTTVSMIEHFGALGINGALAVYTRDGITPEAVKKADINAIVDGYYLPRAFPLPQPDEKNSRQPDFRQVEYWNGDIKTDETGKALLRFFSSDALSQFLIHVEGVTDKGGVGVGELTYEVKY